jgi:hypothetical protein
LALAFVFDEHLRGLRQAIVRHNRRGLGLPLDVVCVGDVEDLPLGSLDTALLLWAEREERLVVTLDQTTMPGHLSDLLQAGHHSPGILVLNDHASWQAVVDYLQLVAHAGTPDDFRDAVRFGP